MVTHSATEALPAPAAGVEWEFGSILCSTGALLSIVLAFRSNISRLPPLPLAVSTTVKAKAEEEEAKKGASDGDADPAAASAPSSPDGVRATRNLPLTVVYRPSLTDCS